MDFNTPGNSPLQTPINQQQPGRRHSISVDSRWIAVLLLVVIAGMLAAWRPWSGSTSSSDDRTIRVSGEATVKSEPDEYVFSPSYQFTNSDRAAALDALAKKNTELLDGLKKLGIADKQIKTNANDYQSGGVYYMDDSASDSKVRRPEPNYTLQLTITIQDKALTQKVQDYLAGTTPSGNVSPYASFSTAKRKQLEDQARDEATKDARKKAEQSADNLGFKLGDVKTVGDGNLGAYPMAASDSRSTMEAIAPGGGAAPSLGVHAGENELNYSVSVEYYVR